MITWLESIWQDVRYGARLLRTAPGFAVVAVLSLALGVGANTAIFQLLDAIRLRALPVDHAEELATVRIAKREWASGNFSGRYSQLTYPIWEQLRDKQQVFSGIFAFAPLGMNLATGGQARYAQAVFVSGEFFQVLRVPPLLGRVLGPGDDVRGCASPGAVISYGFWQREFGGNRSVVGQTLTLEGHPFPIAGVTPANFHGVEVGRSYDVAIPLCAEPIVAGEYSHMDKRNHWWLASMGRLKPGVSVGQANAQVEAISKGAFEATVPPVYRADAVKHYLEYRLGAFAAATGFSSLRQEYETPLWLLLAIAGLVLLIACANLANLILARASARAREIAVRMAMGATRRRLVRQLLAESLLLASVGAALGALLAQFVSRFLVTFIATENRRLFVDLPFDWRILGFTAGLAVLTCALFGLTPALRATRTSPAAAMSAGGRSTATRERFGVRRALVVSQIALSMVLLVSALLFVRSLTKLLLVDAGFNQSGIVVTDVDLTKTKMPKERRVEYKRQMLERIRAIPGVESAASADIVPVSGNGWNQNIMVNGEKKGESVLNRVSPGYFRTMGTPLLAGRDFGAQDTPTSPKAAIVSDLFAKKYFAGDAVGKTFKLDMGVGLPDPTYEIVGVVRDSKYRDLREEFGPTAYFADNQTSDPDLFGEFMVRSNLPLGSVIGAVKQAIGEMSPEIVIDFRALETQIRDSLLRERLMATLSGAFGVLAVVLATVGLYGVISYMVARRTNEIGIRMALGAKPGDVLGMVMREAGALLGIGLVAGAIAAALAARTATKLLFGLKPWDPLTIAMAIAALALVTAAASLVPAMRAARLEPMAALREE